MDEAFTFAWAVKNYGLGNLATLLLIESDVFVTGNLRYSKWKGLLFPSFRSEPDLLNFRLKRCDEGPGSIALRASLRLIAADGTPENEVTLTENILSNMGFSFRDFVSRMALKRFYLHNGALNIQCIISRTDKEETTLKMFGRTPWNVREIRREWELTNFSQVGRGTLLEVPVPLQGEGDPLFDVRMTMEDTPGEEVVTIQFTRRDGGPSGNPLRLNALITLLDAQRKESEIWKRDQHVFDSGTPEEVWQFPTFISKPHLLKQKNRYLENDVLKLKCEFTVSSGKMTSEIEDGLFTVEACDTQFVDKLTEDMSVLYDTKLFADVELRASGETLPANRIVLQLRSKVFSEMLENVGGTDSATLDVPDVDIITLKRMLKFIYTDQIDDLEYDDAVVAYVAAHKYKIESLKCKYSFVLQSHLKVSNVCSILELADEFYDQDLKNCAVDFITQYWDRVGVSEKWEELSKKRMFLVKEVKELIRRTHVVEHSTYYS